MEREVIINNWSQLQPLSQGSIPVENQVWQGIEYGVSFEVVREILPGEQTEIMVSVTFLGGMQNIHTLHEEFEGALGKTRMAPLTRRGALTYSWLEVDVACHLDSQQTDYSK